MQHNNGSRDSDGAAALKEFQQPQQARKGKDKIHPSSIQKEAAMPTSSL